MAKQRQAPGAAGGWPCRAHARLRVSLGQVVLGSDRGTLPLRNGGKALSIPHGNQEWTLGLAPGCPGRHLASSPSPNPPFWLLEPREKQPRLGWASVMAEAGGSCAGPWEARAASSVVQMKERLRERLTWASPRLRFPARIPPLLSLCTYRGESRRPGGRREPGSRTQKPQCKGLEPSLIFFFLMLVFPTVCVLLS